VKAAQVGAALNASVAELKREFGRRLVEKLKAATPVDTGYARSRWVVAELGPQIDVLNDAPYIMRLNDGWSGQAAAGFIERCIDEVVAEMQIVITRPTRILIAEGELFEYHPAGAAA
jgi:hypothetical protein